MYVADRANNRVQSFKLDGTFLKEGFVKRESKGTGTAFGVALSADPQQRFLYVADGSNERIAILDRASLEEIGHIGGPGRKAGQSAFPRKRSESNVPFPAPFPQRKFFSAGETPILTQGLLRADCRQGRPCRQATSAHPPASAATPGLAAMRWPNYVVRNSKSTATSW